MGTHPKKTSDELWVECIFSPRLNGFYGYNYRRVLELSIEYFKTYALDLMRTVNNDSESQIRNNHLDKNQITIYLRNYTSETNYEQTLLFAIVLSNKHKSQNHDHTIDIDVSRVSSKLRSRLDEIMRFGEEDISQKTQNENEKRVFQFPEQPIYYSENAFAVKQDDSWVVMKNEEGKLHFNLLKISKNRNKQIHLVLKDNRVLLHTNVISLDDTFCEVLLQNEIDKTSIRVKLDDIERLYFKDYIILFTNILIINMSVI